MARKSLFASSEHELKKVKNEIDAARKVNGHGRISKLVGAYVYVEPHTESDIYNILSVPVADCNLDEFLDACDAVLDRESSELRERWSQSWRRLNNAISVDKKADREALLERETKEFKERWPKSWKRLTTAVESREGPCGSPPVQQEINRGTTAVASSEVFSESPSLQEVTRRLTAAIAPREGLSGSPSIQQEIERRWGESARQIWVGVAIDWEGWERREPPLYKPPETLIAFLRKIMGCATEAICWMHLADIAVAHQDIKPAKFLLRNGSLFVTDFGISRDRRNATKPSTDRHDGKSDGWCAPGVDEFETRNPYQADVYSLGCVFLHMTGVVSGAKSRHQSPQLLKSHLTQRESKLPDHQNVYRTGRSCRAYYVLAEE